ncbi:MAG TPA: response regulator [Phycisphaerae bacterium]|nr:response regulator [Phycisphaerae bacterium]HNU45851.1 response regulator [Phycisphaerae bacterium]
MAGTLEGKTVLVVDDDPDMVAALRMVLDETGATIKSAGDGNAALTMAAEFNPDVVVLDAMLPKRSGFLVLEKLKAKKKKGDKPYVIMITGNQGKRHQLWAESLGVDGYLNKPFRMDRLIGAIEGFFSEGPKQPAPAK